MKLTKLTIIILAAVAVVVGFVWLRHLQPTPRSLYGKASLSEDEKRILYRPFEDRFKTWYPGKDYKIGIICLKHRLTRAEVLELIAEPPYEPRDYKYLFYRTGPNGLFSLEFDENGNLKKAEVVDSRYQLPPLESVTPDTPIEPPSLR